MEPISIIDLQKQITELSTSIRNLKWFTIIMFLIFIGVYTLSANWKKDDLYAAKITALEATIAANNYRDSMQIVDIRNRGISDSLTNNIIYNKLNNHDNMLTNITRKHDQKRNIINNSSDDEQLSILAGWLSQTDSL